MKELKTLWDLGRHFWLITDFLSLPISSLVTSLDGFVSAPLFWSLFIKTPWRLLLTFFHSFAWYFPLLCHILTPTMKQFYFGVSLNIYFDSSWLMLSSWNLYFLHRYTCNYFHFLIVNSSFLFIYHKSLKLFVFLYLPSIEVAYSVFLKNETQQDLWGKLSANKSLSFLTLMLFNYCWIEIFLDSLESSLSI